jgi:hypothetical protein
VGASWRGGRRGLDRAEQKSRADAEQPEEGQRGQREQDQEEHNQPAQTSGYGHGPYVERWERRRRRPFDAWVSRANLLDSLAVWRVNRPGPGVIDRALRLLVGSRAAA